MVASSFEEFGVVDVFFCCGIGVGEPTAKKYFLGSEGLYYFPTIVGHGDVLDFLVAKHSSANDE